MSSIGQRNINEVKDVHFRMTEKVQQELMLREQENEALEKNIELQEVMTKEQDIQNGINRDFIEEYIQLSQNGSKHNIHLKNTLVASFLQKLVSFKREKLNQIDLMYAKVSEMNSLKRKIVELISQGNSLLNQKVLILDNFVGDKNSINLYLGLGDLESRNLKQIVDQKSRLRRQLNSAIRKSNNVFDEQEVIEAEIKKTLIIEEIQEESESRLFNQIDRLLEDLDRVEQSIQSKIEELGILLGDNENIESEVKNNSQERRIKLNSLKSGNEQNQSLSTTLNTYTSVPQMRNYERVLNTQVDDNFLNKRRFNQPKNYSPQQNSTYLFNTQSFPQENLESKTAKILNKYLDQDTQYFIQESLNDNYGKSYRKSPEIQKQKNVKSSHLISKKVNNIRIINKSPERKQVRVMRSPSPIKHKCRGHEEIIQKLRLDLQRKDFDIEDLRRQLESSEKQNRNLKPQIGNQEIIEQLRAKNKELLQRLFNLEEDNKILNKSNLNFQDQFSILEQEIQNKNLENERTLKLNDQLKKELDLLRRDMRQIQSGFKEQIVELENLLQKSQNDLKQKNFSLLELQKLLEISDQKLESFKSQMDEVVKGYKFREQDLISQNQSYQSQINDLTMELGKAERESKRLRDSLSKLNEDMRISNSQVQNDIQNYKQTINNITIEIESYKEENRKLSGMIESLKQQIDNLREELTEKEKDLQTSRTQIKMLEDTLKEERLQHQDKMKQLEKQFDIRDKKMQEEMKRLKRENQMLNENLDNAEINVKRKDKDGQSLQSQIQEYQKMMRDLESKVKNLENEKENLQKNYQNEIDEGNENLRKLRENLENLKFQNQKIIQKNQVQQDNIDQLEKGKQNRLRQFQELSDEIEKLKRDLREAQTANRDLMKDGDDKVKQQNQMIISLKNKVKDLEGEYRVLQGKAEAEIEKLAGIIRSQKVDLNELGRERDGLKDQINDLMNQLRDQERIINNLRTELQNFKEEKQSLSSSSQSEIQRLQERLKKRENRIRELEDQLSDSVETQNRLKRELDEIVEIRNQIMSQKENLQDQLRKLELKNGEQRNQIDQMRRSEENLNREIQDLKRQIKDLNRELESSKENLYKSNSEIKSLKEQVKQLQKDNGVKEDTIERLQRELRDAQNKEPEIDMNEINRLKKRIIELENEIETITEEMETYQEKYQVIQEALSQTKDKYLKMQERHDQLEEKNKNLLTQVFKLQVKCFVLISEVGRVHNK